MHRIINKSSEEHKELHLKTKHLLHQSLSGLLQLLAAPQDHLPSRAMRGLATAKRQWMSNTKYMFYRALSGTAWLALNQLPLLDQLLASLVCLEITVGTWSPLPLICVNAVHELSEKLPTCHSSPKQYLNIERFPSWPTLPWFPGDQIGSSLIAPPGSEISDTTLAVPFRPFFPVFLLNNKVSQWHQWLSDYPNPKCMYGSVSKVLNYLELLNPKETGCAPENTQLYYTHNSVLIFFAIFVHHSVGA